MQAHKALFSRVFVVLFFICLFEVGYKVSLVSATEVVPRLPDLNGDGVVNILDLTMWARSWNSHPGDPNWNSAADLNCDGVVNVRDAVILVTDLGKNCRFYDLDDPSSWSVSSGSWSVQNGTLEGSSSHDGLIYVGDAAWKDATFTARLKFAGDSEYTEAAVAFFGDPNNFYYAGLGCWGHRVSISTRVGGVWRELAFSGDVADVEKDIWYVLAIKVSGGAIMLYLDGSLELSVNDSTFVSGSVGISIWDSHVIVDYVTAIGTIDRSNANLAVIPDDWYLTYSSGPQIIFLDYNVVRTSGKPSIRLEPHTSSDINTAREVDGTWYNIKPGDHVVAKCWIRVLTGPSTNGYPNCGGRIGIDFYGGSPYRLLYAAQFWSDYYGGDFSKSYLHDSNGGAWQQKVLDFIVPATVGDSVGIPQVATSFVLWLQGAPWNVDSTASNVWFADAELYINPA